MFHLQHVTLLYFPFPPQTHFCESPILCKFHSVRLVLFQHCNTASCRLPAKTWHFDGPSVCLGGGKNTEVTPGWGRCRYPGRVAVSLGGISKGGQHQSVCFLWVWSLKCGASEWVQDGRSLLTQVLSVGQWTLCWNTGAFCTLWVLSMHHTSLRLCSVILLCCLKILFMNFIKVNLFRIQFPDLFAFETETHLAFWVMRIIKCSDTELPLRRKLQYMGGKK